jgi:hypothetical protein
MLSVSLNPTGRITTRDTNHLRSSLKTTHYPNYLGGQAAKKTKQDAMLRNRVFNDNAAESLSRIMGADLRKNRYTIQAWDSPIVMVNSVKSTSGLCPGQSAKSKAGRPGVFDERCYKSVIA